MAFKYDEGDEAKNPSKESIDAVGSKNSTANHRLAPESAEPVQKESPMSSFAKKPFDKKQKMRLAAGGFAALMLAGAGTFVMQSKGRSQSAFELEMRHRVSEVAAPKGDVAPPPVAVDLPKTEAPAPAPQPLPQAALVDPVAPAQVEPVAPAQQAPAVAPVAASAPSGVVDAAPAYPSRLSSSPSDGLMPPLEKPVRQEVAPAAVGDHAKQRAAIESMREVLDRISVDMAEQTKLLAAKRVDIEKLKLVIAEAKKELGDYDKKAKEAQRVIERALEKQRYEAAKVAREDAELLARAARAQARISAREQAALVPVPMPMPMPVQAPVKMQAGAPVAAAIDRAPSAAEYRQATQPKAVENVVVSVILSDGVVMPNGDLVEVGRGSRRLGGKLTGVNPAAGTIEVNGVSRNATIKPQ